MKKILNFNNLTEFYDFIKIKTNLIKIGKGTEGVCFLSKNNEEVYKVIINGNVCGEPYNINKIITIDDFNTKLSHYIFPEELYVVKSELVGYKTKYIKEKNYLEDLTLFQTLNQQSNLINKEAFFNSLFTCYTKLLKETAILSKEKIKIYDISANLFFTGNNLYIIDTCGYKRVNEDISTHNQEKIDEAMKDIFEEFLSYSYCDENSFNEIMKEENVEKCITKIKCLVKK